MQIVLAVGQEKTTFEDVHVFYASKIDEVTYSEGLDSIVNNQN